ncbi:MAG: iron-sulfur cluster assembly accessory protein [Saprospiraceae bacterium]|nr:iron-sulfur cluster assembly accessory protein [Saprospiraceae bacterium]
MLYVSDSAKEKILEILDRDGKSTDHYFVRVTVTSGGCSGLTYQMDFDNEDQPNDQVFEDKGIKVVTDLKSFLYLHNTTLEFSGGLNGKGFFFSNPNAARTCACGESFSL